MPGAALAQGQSWGAAPAQQPPRVTDSQIIAMIDEGMTALNAGDLPLAYDRFTTANDITFKSDDFGLTAKHLPNLALARYAMKTEDWGELGRFSASVATALDVEGYRDHPYRIEAMAFQGVVAYLDDRLNEAELILRAALAATEGRPELAIVNDLAHYYLANTAFQVQAPDATALRQSYLEAPAVPGSWVKAGEVALLFYVDVFVARGQGDSPAALMMLYEEFLDLVDGHADIDPQMMSFYRGFLGLLQFEAGENEKALETFRVRHEFLMENGPIDDDFLFNVQRLAMTRRNLGDIAGAYDFLAQMMEFARTYLPGSGIYAIFEKDMGDFQVALGHPGLAQPHYRRAYAILRQTRPTSDPEVLAVRPLIDLDDPGIDGYAHADELRAVADLALELAGDGVPLLTQFFQGRYLNLDAQLGLLNAQGQGGDPLFLTNRALFFGLMGYRDRALRDLEAAGAALGHGTAMLDLVELVARAWGAEADPGAAQGAVDRLLARLDDLDPARRSAALALIAYRDYRLEDTPAVLAGIDRWQAQAPAGETGVWHLFASAIIVELAASQLDPSRAAPLADAFEAAMAGAPDLSLLRDYGRMVAIANAPDTLGSADVEVELGGLLRRMQARLPRHHGLIALTEFALGNAFQWRGELDRALVWLDRATTTLRSHPFHDTDTLAFVLSEQSRLLIELGRTDQAALIAREAYEMVDPQTGRPNPVSTIVSNFAYAILSRTEDHRRVAEIYARHLDDPVYADRIPPLAKVRQLIAYANELMDFAPWDKVRAVLERAEASMPDNGFDIRGWQASLDWSRAIAEYRFDQADYGFARMRASNATLAQVQEDLRAAGITEVSRGPELRNRAAWTALIGWDYAQTLPQ